MGTIYPIGYLIGGKGTEYNVNGIWELYSQPDIQLWENVQNVKLMEYGRKSERAQPLSQGVY